MWNRVEVTKMAETKQMTNEDRRRTIDVLQDHIDILRGIEAKHGTKTMPMIGHEIRDSIREIRKLQRW
jgi:hypothetical protein